MTESFIRELHNLLATHPQFNLLWAFLAGVLSSLTPCVYPLIPITLAIFGASAEKSRRAAFFLSCCYVLGIAVTYTALGIISARSGILFGSLLSLPAVVLLISLVIILLSLFTLDIVRFDFAYRLQSRAGRIGGKGALGAFLMGAASGLVAAPCVGPVLIVILGIAAASQSTWWGAALLFSYSLGLGILFLVLGTFSGLIKKLPRSGDWLKVVKLVIAVALFVVVLFLLHSVLPSQFGSIGTAAQGVVLSTLAILALLVASVGLRHESKVALLGGSVLLAISVYFGLIFSPPSLRQSTEPKFASSTDPSSSIKAALAQARIENKIIILDFSADWCAACLDLEAKTFADPAVRQELERFIFAHVDFTNTTAETEVLTEHYSIIGLPVILFLDSNDKEIPNSRISGFIGPKEFVEHLKRLPLLPSNRYLSTENLRPILQQGKGINLAFREIYSTTYNLAQYRRRL